MDRDFSMVVKEKDERSMRGQRLCPIEMGA